MRRCGRPPTSSRGPTSGSRRPRRTGGRRPRLGLRGGLRGRRSGTCGMEVVRDRGARVVHDPALLQAGDQVTGHRDAAGADRDVSVDDELPRLMRGECKPLHEGEGLEPPGEDRLHVEAEDVVEGRALRGEEAEPPEAADELVLLLPRLLVAVPDLRLELPGPLPESPEDVLPPPQFLLVLQSVFLHELVLRLDPLPFPRLGGPLVLLAGKLRVFQPLPPSSPSRRPLPSSRPSRRRLRSS